MGLLSNVKTRRKLVTLISQHNNKLCFLSYVAGIIWFLALAYRPFNANTYFSENALLPGLVEANFHHDHGAPEVIQSLKDELRAIKNLPKKEDKDQIYRIPTAWFEERLRNLGLDTYVQNFTFKYPAGLLGDHAFQGQNLYGILRGPRAASTEAIVLSVPYRPPDSDLDKTNSGIALMLALARNFRQHTYWAKDIIFLVTEHESIGMQAWLGAYHNDHNEFIQSSELHGRSGSIQAALNLEIGTDSIHRFNIKLEGLNGQLPNLDLINTVVRLCRRESINPTLQKQIDTWDTESWKGFQHNLKTMVSMMLKQAPGSPTGNHGLFHRYHIEAITLQGVKRKSNQAAAGYREMGRVVEGVVRSLNNLLERFHQSFFFYLLPATDRYVSIGLYMPPFGLIALPIIIKALALWISVSFGEEDETTETTDNKPSNANGDSAKDEDSEEKKESEDVVKEEDKNKEAMDAKATTKAKERPGIAVSVPIVIMAMMFGFGALNGPTYFMDAGRPFKMRPSEAMFWGALALQFSSMLFPRILKRKADAKGDIVGPDPSMLKCLGLLAVGVIVSGTALINISLAVIITVAWTPVLLFIFPSKRRLMNLLQYLLLLAISPMGLLYLSCIGAGVAEGLTEPHKIHARGWQLAQHGLLTSIVESSLLGNLTYSLVSLTYFPVWLVFWALLWTDVQ